MKKSKSYVESGFFNEDSTKVESDTAAQYRISILSSLANQGKGQPMQTSCNEGTHGAHDMVIESHHNSTTTTWRVANKAGKALKTNKKPIPQDIMVELEHEVFQHEHITTHRSREQILQAAKVVQALRSPSGLSSILDEETVGEIVHHLSTSDGLDEHTIRQAIFHQFGPEERIELYERLNNSLSREYGGTGKKVSLYAAAVPNSRFGKPGFSRLVLVWLKPPVIKTQPTPTIPEEIKPFVEQIQKKFPKENEFYLVKLVKELMFYHENTLIPYLQELKHSRKYSSFKKFLFEFMEFALMKNQALEPNSGWLRPGSKTFGKWEKAWKSRVIVDDNEISGSIASAKARAEKERMDKLMEEVQGFYDEHGKETAIEIFGKELVDKIRLW